MTNPERKLLVTVARMFHAERSSEDHNFQHTKEAVGLRKLIGMVQRDSAVARAKESR